MSINLTQIPVGSAPNDGTGASLRQSVIDTNQNMNAIANQFGTDEAITSNAFTQANIAANTANAAYALANTVANSIGINYEVDVFLQGTGLISNAILNIYNTATINANVTTTHVGGNTANIGYDVNSAAVLASVVSGNTSNIAATLTAGVLSIDTRLVGGGGGSGSVTNVATGLGLAGGPITTTGTIYSNIANTTQQGVTKLIDSVSSTDTGNAATANALNEAYVLAALVYGQANVAANSVATYANGTIVLPTSNINWNNTATINVGISANGTHQTNVASNVNVAAVLAGIYSSNTSNLVVTLQANGNVALDTRVISGNGGGSSPGGSNTTVQFNNNGVLGGSANLSFNLATNVANVYLMNVSNIANIGNANIANLISPNVASFANGTIVTHAANLNWNNTTTINVGVTANGQQTNVASNVNVAAVLAGVVTGNSSNITVTYAANGNVTIDTRAAPGTTNPGGANGQIQFNNNAVFGGTANLLYNIATHTIGAEANLQMANGSALLFGGSQANTANAQWEMVYNVSAGSLDVIAENGLSGGTPAYLFGAQTNTGMYLAAANTIGFSANSNNVMKVSQTSVNIACSLNVAGSITGSGISFANATTSVRGVTLLIDSITSTDTGNAATANAVSWSASTSNAALGLAAASYLLANVPVAYKTVTSNSANATLTVDSNLVLTFTSTGPYRFELFLPFYETTGSTGGFQFDLGSNTAVTSALVYDVQGYGTSALALAAAVTSNNTTTSVAAASTSSTSPSWLRAKGSFNITTAGTIGVRWAQASAVSANVTNLLVGAYFRAEPV